MNKPSRRAVVRTGVWAVPVVAVASAAPAFAAGSTICTAPVCIQPIGTGCKLPGNSTDIGFGYRMVVTFRNCTGVDQTVTIDPVTGFIIDGKPTTALKPTTFKVPGNCTETDPNITATMPNGIGGVCTMVTVDGHDCVDYAVTFIVQSSSSSQRTAEIQYKVASTGTTTYDAFVDFSGFNPCKCKQNDADPYDPTANCS